MGPTELRPTSCPSAPEMPNGSQARLCSAPAASLMLGLLPEGPSRLTDQLTPTQLPFHSRKSTLTPSIAGLQASHLVPPPLQGDDPVTLPPLHYPVRAP